MALDNAVLTWNANTEIDLSKYRVYYGQFPGLYSYSIDINIPSVSIQLTSNYFNNDGLWYFALSALDTSNNESAKTTAVSKWIVRLVGSFRHRR